MFADPRTTYNDVTEKLRSVILVKTAVGYCPLLVDDSASNVLDSNKDDTVTHYCEFLQEIKKISEVLEINMDVIYDHLVHGTTMSVQARAEGYFTISTCLGEIEEEWKLERPQIRDGRDDAAAWCLLFPFDITVDELVPIIKTHLTAIGGVFHNNDDELTVYFFSNHQWYSEYQEDEYRHCVSYIIDKESGFSHCGPLTYEEKRENLKRDLEDLSDEDDEQEIRAELAEIATKRSHDPYPPEKYNMYGKEDFISYHTTGVQCFMKVPFNIQVAACAKVAGVSIEEMFIKLRACTSSDIEF